MHTPRHIQRPEVAEVCGDRHSIARQVFDSFLTTVRQGTEMQTMVNRYR